MKIYCHILSRYDDIYEQLEKINSNYKEELKKSILQYTIQGKLVKQDPNDEPADVLINKILSEKRKLIKSKKIIKENLSVIYKIVQIINFMRSLMMELLIILQKKYLLKFQIIGLGVG